MNTIYTVIPYFSDGIEVNLNYVKSFHTFTKAEEYSWELKSQGIFVTEIIENEIE